jgi:ribosomal protein L37AE/L43A
MVRLKGQGIGKSHSTGLTSQQQSPAKCSFCDKTTIMDRLRNLWPSRKKKKKKAGDDNAVAEPNALQVRGVVSIENENETNTPRRPAQKDAVDEMERVVRKKLTDSEASCLFTTFSTQALLIAGGQFKDCYNQTECVAVKLCTVH